MSDTIKNVAKVVLVLLVVGAIATITILFVGKIREGGDKANELVESTERATFKEFDDNVVKGSSIKAFITTNLESNVGVVVVTRKDASDASGGLNYIRPVAKEDDSATYADRASVESSDAKGTFKNLIGIKDKSKWEEGNEVKGKFASDDVELRATSLKYAKRSGNKHQIQDNANFDCKLITDGNKPIGIYCIEKGVMK